MPKICDGKHSSEALVLAAGEESKLKEFARICCKARTACASLRSRGARTHFTFFDVFKDPIFYCAFEINSQR